MSQEASREWTAADAERVAASLERLDWDDFDSATDRVLKLDEEAAELIRWQAARIAELEARPAVPASGQQLAEWAERVEVVARRISRPSEVAVALFELAELMRFAPSPAPGQQDVPDQWCRTFAESVVKQLADSEPTEEAIEGQELLKGSIAETCFVVTGEELCSQIECAVSNAFYDGKIALLTPSPART